MSTPEKAWASSLFGVWAIPVACSQMELEVPRFFFVLIITLELGDKKLFKMKSISQKGIIILVFLLSNHLFSQSYLEKQNGFREIKLGSNINLYHDFIKKDSLSLKYFGIWTEYDYVYSGKEYNKIGNVEINNIFIKVVNNLIYEILITTDKNLELLDLLRNAYGKPTIDENGNLIGWYYENIRCRVIGKSDFYKLFFITYEDVKLEDKVIKLESEEKVTSAKKQF